MSSYYKKILISCALVLFAPLAQAQVIITEIMYHAASDSDSDEYVELYNAGAVQALDGWCVDGIFFCFPPGTTIDPGEYIILARDPAQFLTTYNPAPAPDVYGYPTEQPTGSLNDNGERIALVDNLLAVQDELIYNDDGQWPITPDGIGPSLEVIDPTEDNAIPRNWRASTTPTPGAVNSVDAVGLPPWIDSPQHTPDALAGNPILITATVLDATSVTLFYRLDFAASESSTPMLDDGQLPDATLDDDVFSAEIPGQADGTLIRYRIEASGPTGAMSYPRTDDTVVYDGTAIIDPALVSAIPILHWFMDPIDYQAGLDHRFTDDTEPAMLFFEGQLYDGVQARIRGQSSRGWDKPSWKFLFPQGHNFDAPGLIDRSVDNFNLQTPYSDKSYVREVLAWETVRDARMVHNQAFSVRVEQNGSFHGLYNWLEAVDKDWVTRNGLDQNASRYKAFGDMREVAALEDLEPMYQKESRLGEDYSDLFQLTTAINTLSGDQLVDYIYDNIDIPATLNYMATQIIYHNNDHTGKNYFLYRDTEGTGRWTMQSWDLDLTFGRNWIGDSLNDTIWADVDLLPELATNITPSHPMLGSRDHRKYSGSWNRLIDAMLMPDAGLRKMYFRRLRSLMDQLLFDGGYEARIDEMVARIAPEAALDRAAWPSWGEDQDQATAVDILKNEYLVPRRVHLFITHRVCDIPGAQAATAPIVINEIMYDAPGGSGDEYIELYNPSQADAVDLSGWRLDGVALTIPPGTVILPDDYVLFVKNDTQFRATYGGGHLVGAEYQGSLYDFGESIVLRNQFGGVISAVTFDDVNPWPSAPAGGGASLELIDPAQANDKVANWAASDPGGTPGAVNSRRSTTLPIPELFINEVLPVNVSLNTDEQSETEPWIEIYNGGSTSIDLSGMFLTDDLAVTTMWEVPAGTVLAASDWLLVWADNEADGPLHANFVLSGAGGVVGLYDSGVLVDYLNYDALPADRSQGRFPDGGAEQRIFEVVTPVAANVVPSNRLILNEYNAVSPDKRLKNNGSDPFWGQIDGNGGDWIELVVTEDHLDITNWGLSMVDDTTSATLTFGDEDIWTDLRTGTIITISEDLPDNLSYDPPLGDWWINVQASDTAGGINITAQDFEVTNENWQLTILDEFDMPVFGPAGEGIAPVTGISSEEVFKLEEDPGKFTTPFDDYNDGSSSTFGLPNVWGAGSQAQDFTTLRQEGLTGACSNPDMDGDLVCDFQDNCPEISNPDQLDDDGDGIGNLCDTCPNDPFNDADSDAICGDIDNCPDVSNNQDDGDLDNVGDACDNCPDDSNANQADDDADGLGDVCDSCLGDPVNDPDLDGVCHSIDNCPLDANPGDPQDDADGDGLGDVCDACPNDADNDIDLDGDCGDMDNCPLVPNEGQADGDGDGFGDLCDNCPEDGNVPQMDTDGDGQGDVCDDDTDDDGVLDDGDGSGTAGDNFCPLKTEGQTWSFTVFAPSAGPEVVADRSLYGDSDPILVLFFNADGNALDGIGLYLAGETDFSQFEDFLYTDGTGTGTPGITDGIVSFPSLPVGDYVARLFFNGTLDEEASNAFSVASLTPPGPSQASNPSIPDTSNILATSVTLFWSAAADANSHDVYFGTNPTPAAAEFQKTQTGTSFDPGELVTTTYYWKIDENNLDCDDNCRLVVNPDQSDSDGNGVGDACDADDDGDGILDDGDTSGVDGDNACTGGNTASCDDNCIATPNPAQTDTDDDLVGDACDCSGSAGTSSVPGYVGNTLILDNVGGATLYWVRAPQGHVSNIYRGSRDIDAGWSYNETCLASEIAGTDQIDAEVPASRVLFYYLLTGRNTCGEGPAGRNSSGINIIPAIACATGSTDTDSDGVIDLEDNCATTVNPLQEDNDFDFVGNLCDDCPDDPDPTQLDTDGDGAGDACDPNTDGDVILDDGDSSGTAGDNPCTGGNTVACDDNCPLVENADQADFDGDGIGDVCDNCTDTDGDGMGDPGFSSPDCVVDPFPNDFENDADGDGISGEIDNCPQVLNPDQEDEDLDGTGDACDICPHDFENDADADGICAGQCGVIEIRLLDFIGSEETVFVEFGTSMRYIANQLDPGIGLDWITESFDDTGWTLGTYGIGYEAGTGAEDLLQTTVPIGTRSVYTRTEVQITNVSEVNSLLIGADYDDGFIAWINGTEVYRSPTMPLGDPTWDTSPNAHESSNDPLPDYGVLVNISGPGIAALHNGTNIFAVGGWNRQPPTPPSSDLVLVPKLAINPMPTMVYLANTSDPLLGTSWTSEFFDDSSWTAGAYGIGYDTQSNADNLLQTIVAEGTLSVYTRTQFEVVNLQELNGLVLGVDYDDGFVAWINGIEVARAPEMPVGDPGWDTDPELHESSNAPAPIFDPFDISAAISSALHVGTNSLAIGIWNQRPESSDLVLAPSLSTSGAGVDNCPDVANSSQADNDIDGVGNACDNCPDDFNPVQADTDADGIGDVCDVQPE